MFELSRLLFPGSFTLAILAVVVLALVLPCRGEGGQLVGIGSEIAVAALFFSIVQTCLALFLVGSYTGAP